MKRIDLNRYTPPGYTSPLGIGSIGALIMALIKTIELPSHIIGARDALYPYGQISKGVIPGAKMAPYLSLIGDSFTLFPLFWAFLALEVFFSYQYHRKDTMSIYLMRRLPDGWELHRRCWGKSLIRFVRSLGLMLAVMVFYYIFYLLLTPKGCLPY